MELESCPMIKTLKRDKCPKKYWESICYTCYIEGKRCLHCILHKRGV